MEPDYRTKYVKEGGGKHRGGRIGQKTHKNVKATKPKRNVQIIVAENVGAKGPGRF